MRLRGLGVHIVVAVVGLPFFSSSLLGDGAWLAGVVLARFVVFGPGATRCFDGGPFLYIFGWSHEGWSRLPCRSEDACVMCVHVGIVLQQVLMYIHYTCTVAW